jgi:class 3 adenylate cyclase
MSDIRVWLGELGLGDYADAFAAEQVAFQDLPHLTDAMLKDIGLPVGPRARVLSAIDSLLTTAPATTESSNKAESRRPSGGERRQLTVMFCDLVGSTALSETLDPEDLGSVMASYRKAASDVVARYDGLVAQYLGDGIMVYFGWPSAHEDDARRAVLAGLGIVDAVNSLSTPASLSVRIGIATGLVVVGAEDEQQGDARLAVGETPNIAARVQGVAAANTVAIAPGTRRLIGGIFDLEDLGSHDLKGVTEQLQIHKVVGEAATESRFEAANVSGLTPFIGRDSEISLMMERWEQAKDGEGQVVLLCGEPGVGKSRISQELRQRVADEPHARLRYQCSPYHTNSAFYPVVSQLESAAGFTRDDTPIDKLRKLEKFVAGTDDAATNHTPLFAAMMSLPGDPYPPLGLTPEQQKKHTIEAITAQVIGLADNQPALVILEDAHWADPTTLDVFGEIIPRIKNVPVLLLVTFRPEFDPPWAAGGYVSAHTLTRLSRRQGADMVAKVTGGKSLPDEVLDQIVAKTDGVPLFVEELTKTVLEAGYLRDRGDRYVLDGPLPPLAIPSTLQDSLMARLDRLSPVKEVAQIGACIGREFPYELISAISLLSETELDNALTTLAESELIFRSGMPPDATYTFKHALVQDAAYASLLKKRRSAIHQSITRALLRDAPGIVESEPETLAHHFAAGGDAAAASPYWEAAGHRAAESSAHVEAAEHFRQALDAAGDDGDTQRKIDVGFALCASLRVLGRIDEILRLLPRIEKMTATDRDKARLHHLRGNIHFVRGETEQTVLEQSTALDHARAANDVEQEIHALSGIADGNYMSGRMNSAFDHMESCIALANKHGFSAIAAGTIAGREHTRYLTRGPRHSRDAMIAGIQTIVDADHLRGETILRATAAGLFLDLVEPDEALEQARTSREICNRIGAGIWLPYCMIFEARALDALGDTERALSMAHAASDLASESSAALVGAWTLGSLATIATDAETVRSAIARGIQLIAEGCVGHNQLWFYRQAAEACLSLEDWGAAESHADSLEKFATDEPLLWSRFFCAHTRALTRWGKGDRSPTARETLTSLATEAQELGFHRSAQTINATLAQAQQPRA